MQACVPAENYGQNLYTFLWSFVTPFTPSLSHFPLPFPTSHIYFCLFPGVQVPPCSWIMVPVHGCKDVEFWSLKLGNTGRSPLRSTTRAVTFAPQSISSINFLSALSTTLSYFIGHTAFWSSVITAHTLSKTIHLGLREIHIKSLRHCMFKVVQGHSQTNNKNKLMCNRRTFWSIWDQWEI